MEYNEEITENSEHVNDGAKVSAAGGESPAASPSDTPEWMQNTPKTGEIDLDQFANNLAKTPKQEYIDDADLNTDAEIPPFFDENDDGEDTDDGAPAGANRKHPNANKNARRIVNWFDRLAAFGLSIYAKDKDSAKYRAKEHELKDLQSDLAEMLNEQEKDIVIPPWLGIVLTLPTIYGEKFMYAKKQREAMERMEQQEAKRRREEAEKTPQVIRPDMPPRPGEVQDAEVIDFTTHTTPNPAHGSGQPARKKKNSSKNLKPCDWCGTPTINKSTCSASCRMQLLNQKNRNKHGN
jgi:hypothetical protein